MGLQTCAPPAVRDAALAACPSALPAHGHGALTSAKPLHHGDWAEDQQWDSREGDWDSDLA